MEADLWFSNRKQSGLHKWFMVTGERHWIYTMSLWTLWIQDELWAGRGAVSLWAWFQPYSWGRKKLASGTHSVVLNGWPVNTRELGGECRMRWDQSSICWMPWRLHDLSLWPFTQSTAKTFWGIDTTLGDKGTEKCAVSLQLPWS